MEINQKLFEEIMGYKVKDLKTTIDYPDNIVWSEASYKGASPYCKAINIYHYAHLCKEWVISKGYGILVYSSEISGCIVELNAGCGIRDFYNQSEPEAIFKACEWVLGQKVACFGL